MDAPVKLENINSPQDIKKLNISQLDALAGEIRQFLIENVSKTGGHLASNLGVVELTLAIHKIFDTSVDRLIFDVGHQCYVHKMLTGRRDGFENLRKFGGMSGFLRPEESEHDACISGHASNSVSVGLGMARARSLQNKDYSVISVIGDGAMTGGLAYEALADAGQSKEPMIVILNDNEMSITKNVGGLANHLARLRLKPRYLHFRDKYRKIINKVPGGRTFDMVIHAIKNSIKHAFLPSCLFEDLGFTYLGPADGHDIKYLLYLLELARDLNRPVLIHLMTQKGKGYRFSEEQPQNYHGVPVFDVESGKPIKNSAGSTFSAEFGRILSNMAEKDERICAITAAMESGVGLSKFAKAYPRRFFDVGIAEGHAVTMCAGLAKQGMLPVCAVYSTFLQRSYDMIVHDVAISGEHVVFAVDRAGFVGEDGETHHGVLDVAYLSSVPGMRILAPASYSELQAMLEYSFNEQSGPVAIRYSRGGEGEYKENSFEKRELQVLLREGEDVTLVSYGTLINNVLRAAEKAQERGIKAQVYKLNDISDICSDELLKSIEKTGRLIVVEDCVEASSVGQRLSACLEQHGISCKVKLLNAGNSFIKNGEIDKLQKLIEIDSDGIYRNILEACKN